MTQTRLYLINYQGFKEWIEDEKQVYEEAIHMQNKPDEHLEAQYNALQKLQLVNNWS